jgi:4-amino-4-deoxy-L-arabinose transferase-like glycosyltransferase
MTTPSRELSNPSGLRLPGGPKLLLLALLAVGLALRLRLAWANLYTLVLDVTSDDAYYYFQIARNIAAGDGASFDGETPTNGFHPLWLMILTPLFLLRDAPLLNLHLGLTLSALFGVGTIYLVYAIVRGLTGNAPASLAAASFYALHPYLALENANGLETGLTVFLVSLVTWLFLRMASREVPPSPSEYAQLGAASGLMMLARTDMIFLLPPIALYFFVRERGRGRWTSGLAIGLPALVVLAPWITWSLASFGTIVQTSALGLAEFQRQGYIAEHGSGPAVLLARAWEVTRGALFSRMIHLYFVPRAGSELPFFLGAGGMLAAMLLAPLTPQRGRALRQMGLLMVPGSGILLSLLYHSAVRWWLREWYFAPMALLGALLLGVAVDYLHSVLRGTHPASASAGWRRRAVVALYAAFAIGLAGTFGPHMLDRWGTHSLHRVNQLEAARWIDSHTEPDARIGSFNAGIIGYFSERTVVNLDGVVNADAHRARVEKRTREYILAMKLDYLADLQGTLRSARCGHRRRRGRAPSSLRGWPDPHPALAAGAALRQKGSSARQSE